MQGADAINAPPLITSISNRPSLIGVFFNSILTLTLHPQSIQARNDPQHQHQPLESHA